MRNLRFLEPGALTVMILASFAMNLFGEKLPALSSMPDFAEGQEWSIKSVPQSEMKVVIGRIEPWKNKIAVHVSIVDIPVSQEAGAINIREIAHMPFEKSALAASVDKLVAKGVAPSRDFEAGYKQWKEHSGGIYTVSVAQVLGLGHSVRNETTR